MSDTIKIHAVMAGANCAVLCFLTTIMPSREKKPIVHYKTTEESEWHEVVGKNGDITMEWPTTFKFRDRTSAWEFDLFELEVNTTYEIYLTISSTSSEIFIFKTLPSIGSFDYNLEFKNYRPKDVPWTPTPEQEETFRTRIQKFSDILENVGFVSEETTELRITSGGSSQEGFGGITSDGKIYLPRDFYNYAFVHEMRHLLGWRGVLGPSCGYYTGNENWFKVMSFFSMNGNQSRVYYFYGENSALDLDMLYDYFMLCTINGQEVTIFYADDQG